LNHYLKLSIIFCVLLLGSQLSFALNSKVAFHVDQTTKKYYSLSQAKKALEQSAELNQSQIEEQIVTEKQLYDMTVALRRDFPSQDNFESVAQYQKARARLEELLQYQSVSYIPIEDAGREQFVPAYQIAASAQATLIHWDIVKYEKAAVQMIAEDSNALFNSLKELTTAKDVQRIQNQTASDAVQSDRYHRLLGITQALKNTTETELRTLVEAINQNFANGDDFPTIFLLTIADQLGDVNFYKKAIRRSTQVTDSMTRVSRLSLLRAIGHLPEKMTQNEKIEVLAFTLEFSKDHQEFTEVALLAMSEFVDVDEEILATLNRLLSDKKYGATAAKALSHSKDLKTLQQLSENLVVQNSKRTVDSSNRLRRSLLAIYLIKNNLESGLVDEAENILQNFQQWTTDSQLKKEVAQWIK